MYLKQLEMNGFKSFVESRLFFQPGITAVVGPNGTGKSNILDAILWVASRAPRRCEASVWRMSSSMAPSHENPMG